MRSVNVIPASNVYYEDSFVTFNPGSYGDNNPISWTTVKSGAAEKEATQKLSELGTVFYDPNGVFNSTGDTQCSFWFDAVRIYNPMGKDVTDYTSDHEGYPQYIKLRTEIGKSTELAGSRALFIDGAAAATVEQYKNYGPNNEVYLGNGQAISFKLPANTNIATVQIGAKSPNATKDAPAVMNITHRQDQHRC